MYRFEYVIIFFFVKVCCLVVWVKKRWVLKKINKMLWIVWWNVLLVKLVCLLLRIVVVCFNGFEYNCLLLYNIYYVVRILVIKLILN